MVLDTPLPNTQQYKVRIKGKVGQSRERSSASPTPRWSSYWKESIKVTLDYGHELTIPIEFKWFSPNYIASSIPS